jgi:hypothetical protein
MHCFLHCNPADNQPEYGAILRRHVKHHDCKLSTYSSPFATNNRDSTFCHATCFTYFVRFPQNVNYSLPALNSWSEYFNFPIFFSVKFCVLSHSHTEWKPSFVYCPIVTLNGNQILCTAPIVTLNGNHISQGETAQYLGIYLNKRLTWRTHIFAKRLQLGLKFQQMYWILGRKSELSIENKLLIYKTILKPIWTYGIPLWGTASNSDTETLEISK